jgi:hypothetical protein
MKSGTTLILCAIGFAASLAPARADDGRARQQCISRSTSVQPLAMIVNTRDANFNCLGLSVDGHGDVVGIRFEKHEPRAARGDAGQYATGPGVREIAPAEIAGARGAVLDGVPGHDAVLLRGNIASRQNNVPLVVSFLYNGFTGEYRACNATLARAPDGAWHLLDEQKRQVSLITVRTWRLPVVGIVGIETIQGICTSSG